jgi:hypothetical protein
MPSLLLRKLPDDASNKVTTFSMPSSSDSENSKTGRSNYKTKPPRRYVIQEDVTVTNVKALIFRSKPMNSLMSDPTNMLRLQASTLHKGQQDDRSSTSSTCFPGANTSSRWVDVDEGGSMAAMAFFLVGSPSPLL